MGSKKNGYNMLSKSTIEQLAKSLCELDSRIDAETNARLKEEEEKKYKSYKIPLSEAAKVGVKTIEYFIRAFQNAPEDIERELCYYHSK
jgi:hypothetical protein